MIVLKFIKNNEHGSASLTFIFIALIVIFAFLLVDGVSPVINKSTDPNHYVLVAPSPSSSKKTLQLETLQPISSTPQTNQCQNSHFNSEQGILLGLDPAPGGSVVSGKVRAWVTDEKAPIVAPGEIVDPTSGAITKTGDRTARNTTLRGKDNYLWEPAIYLTAITDSNINGPYSGDAENGGNAYFPSFIKGQYNSNISLPSVDLKTNLLIDSDYTSFENGPDYLNKGMESGTPTGYNAEYVWDINSFGLPPGSYRAEFTIHDGDGDLAIDCVTIQL